MGNLLVTHAKLARKLGRPARVWPDTPFYERLCRDPDWVAEPKKNGWRCMACAGKQVQPTLWSRHGRKIEKDVYAPLQAELAQLPPARLDGELLIKSGVLWVFDLLAVGDTFYFTLPYSERRALLQDYIGEGSDLIKPVPSWEDPVTKRQSYARAMADGDEGIVFKHRDRKYPTGDTNHWIKCRCSLLESDEVPSYQ